MRRSVYASWAVALAAGTAHAFAPSAAPGLAKLRPASAVSSQRGLHAPGCACSGCAGSLRRPALSKLSMTASMDATTKREVAEAEKLGTDSNSYTSNLQELFPGTVDEGKFIEAMTKVVFKEGFNPNTAINLVSTCRDEICRPFTLKLDSLWGESFNIAALGGFVFCGKTGFGAGMAHSPQEDGKERYIFWVGPHIAVAADGPVGSIYRLGREAPSSACGALIALNGQIAGAKLDVGLDPTDTEMSLLRQEVIGRLSYGQKPNLVGITYAAHDCIVEQVKRTAKIAAPATSEYIIISGIQVHGALGKNYWWPGSITKYSGGTETDLSAKFQEELGGYDLAKYIKSEATASLQKTMGFKGRIDGFFRDVV